MKNKKMIGFVVLGAMTGAVISLFDRGVRHECKDTLDRSKLVCQYYAKHPAELMNQCQKQLAWMADLSETALDLTVKSVNKVEDMLEKIEENV
ncbi:hypothetical protein GCM10012290_17050 [Halolactibacillus alkaliphilus]|uniref:YtxH domain-containing protein n=1 Tax=Halolactibacillus alkaliphilus TaxID=442899 RepID=A0A511X246_9BACI|nr:hypothetical protein [Halolactibacillus alkaliphilus]GEN57022.1 hypothetical protein HAL01_14860 [Halolactibacillus alkaliphilus]GGN71742.1 hypothetical protein GCM10012290_17050 [Halolactibacillus alkaliphilus]SFO85304.1 hypothetical protein SAMN05720591_11657 [Halolactibacillus alkaliphilus]